MKNLVLIITMISFFGVGVQANAQSSKERDEFTVQVDGLGCPFCAYGLEKKFKEFKGIKNVKIDMESGMFTFTYPKDKKLSVDKVEKQVELAGYTPMSVKIVRADGTIENTKRANATLPKDGIMQDEEFFAMGNCDMCKARIEKAVKDIDGVLVGVWNKETKMVTVQFDPQKTSKEEIEKSVVKAGHDTKKTKANNATYENLPVCCHYERIQ